MRTEPFTTPHDRFLYLRGTIFTLLLFIVQCTWTPEVQTIIHNDAQGIVSLITSSKFHVPPQHPHILSQSLVKQVLRDISQSQERGILQELFISDLQPSPVFSEAQIEFLTPHLVDAFSKATPEEFIMFRYQGTEHETDQISGNMAVFSPNTFFLTLEHLGKSAKRKSSSQYLQKHTRLMFAHKKAMLQSDDIHHFIKTSPKDIWIAIDYSSVQAKTDGEYTATERSFSPSRTTLRPEKASQEGKTLQEQLRDLREQIDEQGEEIRRLRETAPQ